MKNNALAVANYFIKLAAVDKRPLHLLGLIKRVYIAHGFSLALNDVPLLDSRFDKVEAWKYGPVIPSVYHSFKQYKAAPITDPTIVMEWNDDTKEMEFVTPKLEDEKAKQAVDIVWQRYQLFSDSDMVSLTHKKGTPWDVCYVSGKNMAIPDEVTTAYYKLLIENILNDGKKQ